MKIKKFNENNSESSTHYIYQIHSSDRIYRGSTWHQEGPWIPDSAKLVGEFEISSGNMYMTVTQEELDEINEIKLQRKIKEDAKKYNL